MGKKVHANGMEIAGKASDNMVVAAFPDVCLSPPSPIAGPIPIPYPDTSKSKDLKKGSKKVKIGGKPLCLQDKSHYKSSPLGDEACTKSFGANVISHTNAGKTHCQAYSMDVKAEGKSVTRTADIATSNHMSAQPGGEAVPMPQIGGTAPGGGDDDDECPCCGGEPHTQAQKEDLAAMKSGKPSQSFSEAQFYGLATSAKHKKVIEDVRANNDKCKQLPDENTREECNRYYKTKTKAEGKNESTSSRYEWEDSQRMRDWREANPAPKYAHRVPLSAGGCPTNTENIQPLTDPDCLDLEERLAEVHGRLAEKLRKAYGASA